MDTKLEPLVLDFPLRGEWLSPNTPGSRIPSHGTDRFGSTYAYDFIQVDWDRSGRPAYRVSFLRCLLFGAALDDYLCWGQPVYAPCGGTVILAVDGVTERRQTHWIPDLVRACQNAHYFDAARDEAQILAGNYVIIEQSDQVYAALCHLKTGSIQVSAGQRVKRGQLIGEVGHSGNSFGPHLHFQLMDHWDIRKARGLPCAFDSIEVYAQGIWQPLKTGIPTDRDRIRCGKNTAPPQTDLSFR